MKSFGYRQCYQTIISHQYVLWYMYLLFLKILAEPHLFFLVQVPGTVRVVFTKQSLDFAIGITTSESKA